MYRYILFDIDDTLLDYQPAAAAIQENVASRMGVSCTPEFRALDEEMLQRAWDEYGLSHTYTPDVQAHYHEYYYAYLRKRFRDLTQAVGAAIDSDNLVDCYMDTLAASRVPTQPDMLDIYIRLSRKYPLLMASNGFTRVQTARVSAFLPYTRRPFISQAVGHIKPSREFFSAILDYTLCPPENCLMIGDSVANDMAGAKAAGLHACLYNPKGKAVPPGLEVEYQIRDMRQLIPLLLED